MPTPNTADLPISEEKERRLVTEHLITGRERQGNGKRHVWSRVEGWVGVFKESSDERQLGGRNVPAPRNPTQDTQAGDKNGDARARSACYKEASEQEEDLRQKHPRGGPKGS